MDTPFAIEMLHITKRFPGIIANDDVTLQLKKPLEEEMEKNGVRRVFDEIEMPLMPVLARMERNGVCLDTESLSETGRLFENQEVAFFLYGLWPSGL